MTAIPIDKYVSSCEIVRGGSAYFEKYIRVIDECRETLFLVVYNFEDDATGRLVARALFRARRRGVQVGVVLDGVGSMSFPDELRDRFLAEGIELRFFSKIYFKTRFRMGRRLHVKLLVADKQTAVVGGINIADRYRGLANEEPWLDFGVFLKGDICKHLHEFAQRLMQRRKAKNKLRRIWERAWSRQPGTEVRALVNDNFTRQFNIRASYKRRINTAKNTLIIFNSYFLLRYRLLRKLGNAVRRGVDVRLVLQGKSDVAVYPSAVKYYYHHLFAAGIKIYEYHKSVLHAKVATQDGRWCTVGSYNINDLSDILSVELNVEIEDPEVAGNFQHYLLDVIENECEPVNPGEYQNASRFTRFRWRMSYYFLLFMFRITYWLTCKEEDFVE